MGAREYERIGAGAPPDAETVLAFEIALRLHGERFRTRPRLISIAAPGAGNDWSTQVPGGVVWHVQAVNYTLTSSATVINRWPGLTVTGDGLTVYWHVFPNPQVAATADVYSFNTSIGAATGGVTELVFGVPIPKLPLLPGWTIGSRAVNLQVGDAYSAISLYVLEVRERQYEERAQAFEAIMAGDHTDNYPGLLLGL